MAATLECFFDLALRQVEDKAPTRAAVQARREQFVDRSALQVRLNDVFEGLDMEEITRKLQLDIDDETDGDSDLLGQLTFEDPAFPMFDGLVQAPGEVLNGVVHRRRF